MDEIYLEAGVPLLVTPTTTTTVYNPMWGDHDLLVSSHGDINKKWLKVEQRDYVKFDVDLWFLKIGTGSVVLPAFETTVVVVP